jgi:hypothetical protein
LLFGPFISPSHEINESVLIAKVERGVKSQAIKEYMAANKEANVQQIFDALKEKGIGVILGLVKAVKYGRKGKKVSVRKVRRAAGKRMLAVSGSESIRQFIAKHPGSGPKEIRQGLKKQGVKVIVVEPYFDLKTPQSIAKQVGGEVLVLAPSVGGSKEAADYVGLFDYDVNAVVAALKRTTGK